MYYYSFSYLFTSIESVEGDSCGFKSNCPATASDFVNYIKAKQKRLPYAFKIQILRSKKVTKEEYLHFYP
jgi:hypothetical protein